MDNRKFFWLKVCLVNLAIVALLGFTLRSKILFSMPYLDYRSFLSAHSHFAFAGWAGMVLTTLLIYNLLPIHLSSKKTYQWILAAMQVSSLGMAISFPLQGYGFWSILFSSAYILINYVFAIVFIKDLVKAGTDKTVKLLSVAGIVSLLLSAIGPFTLAYMLATNSRDSILYRDSIYTFLHFQYNGFFTLSVFALFFQYLRQRSLEVNRAMKRFATTLVASILPGVFLSLLWHNNQLYYAFAIVGGFLLLLSLFYFMVGIMRIKAADAFSVKLARILLGFSLLSFGLKCLLNAGTIIPSLSTAIYGDRPVIIGFLHLVFLAFLSFFVMAQLVEEGMFTRQGKLMKTPLLVFMGGVILNEVLLMIQGLGILFRINSGMYNWYLWVAAIVLLIGASMMAFTVKK